MHINIDLLVIITILSDSCFSVIYPNAILEKPVVTCEPGRLLIQVRTNKSNASHIYAEDHIGDPDCASRNANRLSLSLGNCGMTVKKTKSPASTTYQICITVQLHPLFITDRDQSYCAQCVYIDTDAVEDLQQSLSVSDSTPSSLEPQFDLIAPKCSYQIRRNSIDGPLIHYALLGETVYHVWECYGENFQILVQNCYVEDGEGNQILIINSDGCGTDEYILQTPIYSIDRRTASQGMNVFKFAGKAITRFNCQIRICSSSNDSCHVSTSYIQCAKNEERNIDSSRNELPSAPVQAPRINQKLPASTIETISARLPTIATLSEASMNETSIAHSKLATVDTEASETDKPLFVLATDDYEFDVWSSDVSPPSIKPPPRYSEEVIEAEPNIYQKRTKRNYFTNRLAENDTSLESSKSNKDQYPSYDVSGVLTVLESADDVDYFESKYPSVGTRDNTAVPDITDAGSCSLAKYMPQVIIMALLVLSIILISITIPCIIDSRSTKYTLTSRSKIGTLQY